MARKVVLEFVLQGETDPDNFAFKVVCACSDGGALLPGEGVYLPSSPAHSVIATSGEPIIWPPVGEPA